MVKKAPYLLDFGSGGVYDMRNMTEKEIYQLLRKNDASLTPSVTVLADQFIKGRLLGLGKHYLELLMRRESAVFLVNLRNKVKQDPVAHRRVIAACGEHGDKVYALYDGILHHKFSFNDVTDLDPDVLVVGCSPRISLLLQFDLVILVLKSSCPALFEEAEIDCCFTWPEHAFHPRSIEIYRKATNKEPSAPQAQPVDTDPVQETEGGVMPIVPLTLEEARSLFHKVPEHHRANFLECLKAANSVSPNRGLVKKNDLTDEARASISGMTGEGLLREQTTIHSHFIEVPWRGLIDHAKAGELDDLLGEQPEPASSLPAETESQASIPPTPPASINDQAASDAGAVPTPEPPTVAPASTPVPTQPGTTLPAKKDPMEGIPEIIAMIPDDLKAAIEDCIKSVAARRAPYYVRVLLLEESSKALLPRIYAEGFVRMHSRSFVAPYSRLVKLYKDGLLKGMFNVVDPAEGTTVPRPVEPPAEAVTEPSLPEPVALPAPIEEQGDSGAGVTEPVSVPEATPSMDTEADTATQNKVVELTARTKEMEADDHIGMVLCTAGPDFGGQQFYITTETCDYLLSVATVSLDGDGHLTFTLESMNSNPRFLKVLNVLLAFGVVRMYGEKLGTTFSVDKPITV